MSKLATLPGRAVIEAEVNPLMVLEQGKCVLEVDALVKISSRGLAATTGAAPVTFVSSESRQAFIFVLPWALTVTESTDCAAICGGESNDTEK